MLFFLLFQVFVLISGASKKSKKGNDFFILNFRTTETIDNVRINKKGEEKIECVNNVTVGELSYSVEKKDGLDMFKYKIKIKVKKEYFVTENCEIYVYVNNKELLCIASDFKFDIKDYKLVHLKLYAPNKEDNETKGMLIYDPDEKSIERDNDGTLIFELNDYDQERLLKKKINKLKEMTDFYINSIINLDRECFNLERKHGDLNKIILKVEGDLEENLKQFKNAKSLTEHDIRAFELCQNELFDRKRDYVSFKIRNVVAIEEKRKKKENVLTNMFKTLLENFEQHLKPIISPVDVKAVPPLTSKEEEKDYSKMNGESNFSDVETIDI